MIRRLVLVIVLAAIVAAVAYDRIDQVPLPEADAEAAAFVMPAITDPVPLSSAWHCPMGVAAADQTVLVTNLGTEPVVGSIDVLTSDGPGPSLRFHIPAQASERFVLAELAEAAQAGATVEITSGQAVVGHRIGTSLGLVEGPCATATSSSWSFAGGSTTRDAREIIALLNPTFDDVVFTATFQTPTRSIEPGELEAAVVPARSIRLIEVTEQVSREAVVATEIQTVRGRLVAERLQLVDGTLGPIGAALDLGVVEAATEWHLPVGQLHEGGDARIVLSNPSDLPAEVDLYLEPTDPTDRGRYGLVPEEIDIRAGGVVEIDLGDLVSRIGLPLPAELSIRVTSANLTPFLVERWHFDPAIDDSLIGAGGTNARLQTDETVDETVDDTTVVAEGETLGESPQPTPTRGLLISRGTSVRAERWVFPVLSLFDSDTASTMIVVTAEVDTVVSVRTVTGGSLGTPTTVTVPAEGRVMIPVASATSVAAVLVEADAPIAAEASVVVVDQGASAVAGVPYLSEEDG